MAENPTQLRRTDAIHRVSPNTKLNTISLSLNNIYSRIHKSILLL